MSEVLEGKRTRRGGRGSRRALRSVVDVTMLPALRRRLPLVEPLTPDEIVRIDAASMHILENIGVVFRDPIAIADWRRAGAKLGADIASIWIGAWSRT